MKKKPAFSYKIIIISFVLLLVLIVGTLLAMHFLLRDVQTASGYTNENYSRHYAFIHTDGNDEFWASVYDGALKAGEGNGVYVEDFGSDLTVDYSKDDLMQIAIDASVDGIIIDGDSEDETIQLIGQASQKGIPVVTVLDDSAGSIRITFVGISSYGMGRQYGEKIKAHLKHDDLTTIFVMMDSEHTDNGQDLVISGISDVLSEAGFDDLYAIEGVSVDSDAAFGAEEQIRDIFLAEDPPDIIVALNSVYTKCLYQAVVDLNMVGEVEIYGFDDSEDTLEAVRKEIVEATISVDSSQMGAYAVEAIEEYLDTGYVTDYISQDTYMINGGDAAKLLLNDEEDND